jgi:hypothetical protein
MDAIRHDSARLDAHGQGRPAVVIPGAGRRRIVFAAEGHIAHPHGPRVVWVASEAEPGARPSAGHPGALRIERAQGPTVYTGRVFGLGQDRALTFSVPRPGGGRGQFADILRARLDDRALTGAWLPPNAAERTAGLYADLRRIEGRQPAARHAVRAEIERIAAAYGQRITLHVRLPFEQTPDQNRGPTRIAAPGA